MRIRFWGTRGSIATPGPATVVYGGNTSCVEVRSRLGTLLVLDCGTGARALGHALVAEAGDGPMRGHLLIGHTHWDHIQGLPFFRPLFSPAHTWHVYGPRGIDASLREVLAGQMQYTYFPVTPDQMEAEVEYHDLVEGTFEIDDVKVVTHYLNHPALTVGYRIEVDGAVLVYASDHEPHSRAMAAGYEPNESREDARHVAFLAGADLVIHDTQYLAEEYEQKIGWGHSTVEYAVDCALAAGARGLALYHHDPLRDDAAVAALEGRARDRIAGAGGTLRCFAAAEGQVLSLDGTRSPPPSAASEPVDATEAPALDELSHTVLVASRDEKVRRSLGQAVTADGRVMLNAADVAGALAQVRTQHPALVLAEQALPGGGAVGLCTAIRGLPGASGADVPVIAIAQDEAAASRGDEANAGISDWLVQPFSSIYARTRIRSWLLRRACRWQPAALPPDEQHRLQALRELALLDTAPEERFDRITRLASAMFDMPVAMVSLVDAERQWFKSRVGIEARETPRDVAFCAHAIHNEQAFVVPDALDDDRFADNPLVTDDPRVRFYAGVPLSTGAGQRVGTLCIIDHRPRQLSDSELDHLRALARMVEREFQRED